MGVVVVRSGFIRQLTTWHCPHLLLSAVLLSAPGGRRDRSISPARRAHSSKPALLANDETDIQTDSVPLHRPGRILSSCVSDHLPERYQLQQDSLQVRQTNGQTNKRTDGHRTVTQTLPHVLRAQHVMTKIDVKVGIQIGIGTWIRV